MNPQQPELFTMATIALCRGALRRSVAPVTLGLSTGLFLANRQRPMRLDAAPATSRSFTPAAERTVAASEEWLRPEVIKQLSGGSLAGAALPCDVVASLEVMAEVR